MARGERLTDAGGSIAKADVAILPTGIAKLGEAPELRGDHVWNFLFDRKIDLAAELTPAEFALFITQEVEIEGMAIPDEASKAPLKDYIARTIAACSVRTTSVFGFATTSGGPQRLGGFDGSVATFGCGGGLAARGIIPPLRRRLRTALR
jgi:hypothetical protein